MAVAVAAAAARSGGMPWRRSALAVAGAGVLAWLPRRFAAAVADAAAVMCTSACYCAEPPIELVRSVLGRSVLTYGFVGERRRGGAVI